jgi:hypothetical protein
MGSDNVITMSGTPLITPTKVAERMIKMDKVIAIGDLEGETHLMCSDGYDGHEMIYKLEQVLWLMKSEMFGVPELISDE